ncbi:MAG: hypothetical protein M1838_005877 [Thelocarpon superellum]|nr:MAG: hypothetical protein M1838_005877 [Thelocarpon superellum]
MEHQPPRPPAPQYPGPALTQRPEGPASQLKNLPSVPTGSLRTREENERPTAEDERVTSPENHPGGAASVLSMDDPDVRIAAEALGDLRADFVQSPAQKPSLLNKDPSSTLADSTVERGRRPSQQPEPLLSLLTTSHPLLSTAISGSLSAYSTSKSYSPRFKSSAEFVERHIGTPVVSTVETVGRRTGVEDGVRWWLGSRRPSAVHPSTAPGEHGDENENESENENENEGANKRRKISNATHTSMDLEHGLYSGLHDYGQRRPSQLSFESLPAYDDNRSPKYEVQGTLVTTKEGDDRPTPASTWQSRLILSTSGLGVAMSEESLRSLKYCLTWLRWANVHLGKVIIALKNVLEDYEQSQRRAGPPVTEPLSPASTITDGSTPNDASHAVARLSHEDAILSRRVQDLKSDVLQTLKKVVDIVSKYAGGALPENARTLVRRHLTSLPQRFRLASTSSVTSDSLRPASETVSSATRVMVLAKEGLDMMAQVSSVLDGTIVSAEEWCDRLGRRKRGEPEDEASSARDVKGQVLWAGESTTKMDVDEDSIDPKMKDDDL